MTDPTERTPQSGSRKAGRLGVGVVGAGAVGPVVAAALAGAGHAITGVATTSEQGRERVAALLPGVPILELPQLLERSELVVFAIPGDQLEQLVGGLAKAGLFQAGQLVAHTAPEHGYGVLSAAAGAGAIPLALHPAIVFTGTSLDLSRLAESYIAVSAPAPVLPIAQALAVELGGEPVVVDEEDRGRYAEAVATARDFTASIVSQATGMLSEIGFEQPGAYLSSLLRSGVDEAIRRAGAPRTPVEELAEGWGVSLPAEREDDFGH